MTPEIVTGIFTLLGVAPQEAPESPESPSPIHTPAEAPGEAQEGVQVPERRSWSKRLFGG